MPPNRDRPRPSRRVGSLDLDWCVFNRVVSSTLTIIFKQVSSKFKQVSIKSIMELTLMSCSNSILALDNEQGE